MMNFDPKHITGQLLRSVGAFGIVLTPIFPALPIEAAPIHQTQHVSHPSWGNTRPRAKQDIPNPNDFAVYDAEQFSVNYPKDWQATSQGDNRVAIVSSAADTTMSIRTDISLLREDPDNVVPQKLDQIVASGVAVSRYSLVTINGQSGFRIWYTSETGHQTLTTFIGYGNQQTAILTSHYTTDTQIEALVTTIHGSFVNHSVAQATQFRE